MCAHRAAVPRLVVTMCPSPPSTAGAQQAAQLCVRHQLRRRELQPQLCFSTDSTGSQPSLKAQRISYMLVNCTQPTSTGHSGTLAVQEPSHCWEQGTGKFRERNDSHKEPRDSTKHFTV